MRRRNVSRVGEARPSSGGGEAPGELEARSGELGVLVRLRLPGLRCPRRGLDHHYHQHRLPIPPFTISIPSPPTKAVHHQICCQASVCKTLASAWVRRGAAQLLLEYVVYAFHLITGIILQPHRVLEARAAPGSTTKPLHKEAAARQQEHAAAAAQGNERWTSTR